MPEPSLTFDLPTLIAVVASILNVGVIFGSSRQQAKNFEEKWAAWDREKRLLWEKIDGLGDLITNLRIHNAGHSSRDDQP